MNKIRSLGTVAGLACLVLMVIQAFDVISNSRRVTVVPELRVQPDPAARMFLEMERMANTRRQATPARPDAVAEELPAPQVLELASILVHVVDSVGEPVAHARVNVDGTADSVQRQTDELGRASFDGLSADSYLVSCFGAQQVQDLELKSGARSECTFELLGDTVEIHVVGTNGLAIEGAEVLLSGLGWGSESAQSVGKTDADGFVTVEHIELPWLVEARAAHHVPGGRFRLDSQEFRIELERGGGSIRGRVVDDATGDGVADALVILGFGGAARTHRVDNHLLPMATPSRVRTSEDGGFEVGGLYVSEYVVDVEHESYATLRIPVDVRELADEAHVLRLQEACRITGRVLDERGEPVSGCRIEAVSPDQRKMRSASRIDGSFVLGNLARGRHELKAVKYPIGIAKVSAAAPSDGIEVTLLDDTSVGGVVLDQAGTPMPGVKLRLRSPGKKELPTRVSVSGRDGRFFFALSDGQDEVEVAAYQTSSSTFPLATFPIEVGNRECVLQAAFGAEEGTLTAKCGNSLRITQTATGLSVQVGLGDPEQVHLRGLPAGSYVVEEILSWPDKIREVGSYLIAPGGQMDLGFVGE